VKRTGGQPDAAFERLMARAVARQVDRSADSCPQAEVVAAWFDRSLASDDAAAVETHLASCARCQALAADLARSEPEVVYARPLPQPKPWTWHLRWLTPLAAAAVIALAVSVPLFQQTGTALPGARPEGQVAMLPPAQEARDMKSAGASPAPAQPIASDREQDAVETKRPASRQEQGAADKAESAVLLAERAVAAPPPRPQAPAAERQATGAATRVAGGVAGGAVGGVVAGVATEAARPTMTDAAAPAPVAKARRDAAPAAQLQAAVPPAPVGLETENRAAARARLTQAVAADRADLTPDGRNGWRAGRAGHIERTEDGGTTWTEQSLPAPGLVVAVAPVSSRVCWVVGEGGLVLQTTDGATWRRVSFPTSATLVQVRAENALRATVRTADGVTYQTSDAGVSWQRR